MTEKHKMGQDGVLNDGVSTYPTNEADLQSYVVARQELERQSRPIMLDATNPNSRLFIAAFDGTGNNALSDPEHKTNIALLTEQVNDLRKAGNTQIAQFYVEGVGTTGNPLEKVVDLATGFSYEEKLEQQYLGFCRQAQQWLRENPNAEIRVADIGFSRGAEQAAGFSRLVHERGIMDPDSRRVTVDENRVKHVEYGSNLVPPGQVAQAVVLIDPVGTGEPRNHDRRLPPSVISGFQIKSEDERRSLFKSTHIIDPGLSEDGRFLNVTVGGAHSNLGGSYHRNGLSIRSGNLVVGYLNGLMQPPLLQQTAESMDPRFNVVHRSEEGMLLYRITPKVDRMQPEGYVERLVPDRLARGQDAFNGEPVDEALAAKFTYRRVPMAAAPTLDGLNTEPTDPRHGDHPLHGVYTQIRDGVAGIDARMGRTWDGSSENMAAGLTLHFASHRHGHGMTGVDHVILGGREGRVGENVFLVQGAMDDPTHRRMVADTGALVATPAQQSFDALAQLPDAQRKPQVPEQQPTQQLQQGGDVAIQEAPRLTR